MKNPRISMCEKAHQVLWDWAKANKPSEIMIWAKDFERQIEYVCDTIALQLLRNYKYTVTIISTHISKSIKLPVYSIKVENGLTLIMRGNFHDWNISVKSRLPIRADFTCLRFFTDKETCFCQGFPENLKFGQYAKDKKEFTVCLANEYETYTFLCLLFKAFNESKKAFTEAKVSEKIFLKRQKHLARLEGQNKK
ncbi:hypothetical protein JW977_02660 [Candidatus Falkowbacteria bacterium]|nr:hypothetical protein [Candidatus Falkowbacteria bacterium]